MSSLRTVRSLLMAGTAGLAAAAAAAVPQAARAQDAVDAAREVIVITATKRAGGVNVQDAPLAVTAYGEDQLDARFVRRLDDLSFAMPNVQLNDIGTAKGIANFTIRGIGINSSIPSVDPTVGVFVDGMYLGINAGVVLDTFDLDGVEVLRGPQGLLFGRNVTGGAVLLRTKAPSRDGFTFDGKAAVESGLNTYLTGAVSGPLTEGGALAGKISVYYNDDQGWFHNQYNNDDDFGASETTVVRGALSADLSESLDAILRLEHGETDGDGPAAQNHAVFDRDSFGFAIDNPGYASSDWDQAILEANWRVGFGDGVITNILGWRTYDADTGQDIDSLPTSAFDARTITAQDQWSNELRYSGAFDNVDVTAGLYYFDQNVTYTEERLLYADYPLYGGPIQLTGGGDQDHTTWGAFSQLDVHVNDVFTVNVGVRYTEEEKDAMINSLAINLGPTSASCSIAAGGCTFFDSGSPVFSPYVSYFDNHSWDNVDGKLGFQYQPRDELQIYGFWTSSFRSGGYNFRVTPANDPNFDQSPGPTDPEQVDAYEVGLKYDDPMGRFRLNAAAFRNEISDMQRELNLPGPLGVAQFIRNTADATIQGVELEGQFAATDALLFTAFAGYTDGSYDSVALDLSCNGLAACQPTSGPEDLSLDIPRVAPWSYGVGLIHDLPVGDFGMLTSRINYSHRDKAYYTDNNLGVLNEADMLDASFGFAPDGQPWVFSLYGKNLLSDVTQGGDTQLPPLPPFGGPGASFSPLNKGTVIGIEAQVRY